MKKNTIVQMILVPALVFAFQNRSEAQIKISHGVVANGGGVTSNGQMQIVGTIGQPIVGNSSNGTNNSLGGFWSLPLEIITSVENIPSAVVPKEFKLDQNFPNPVNPGTTIQFAVPSQSEVKLSLFDILGREVATLVDDEYSAGEYKVLFEAPELSSGTYFYQISIKSSTGERFTKTLKLTLLK